MQDLTALAARCPQPGVGGAKQRQGRGADGRGYVPRTGVAADKERGFGEQAGEGVQVWGVERGQAAAGELAFAFDWAAQERGMPASFLQRAGEGAETSLAGQHLAGEPLPRWMTTSGAEASAST